MINYKKTISLAILALLMAPLLFNVNVPVISSRMDATAGNLESSETSIIKTWEAEETLSEWWNANWLYRQKITITEPGLMDRDKDPVDVYVTFSGDVAHENSIRIAYYDNSSTWNEI
ncbi:MAG: hypothetical protein ACTSUE_05530, partial [Promethearchaeota archaeon]